MIPDGAAGAAGGRGWKLFLSDGAGNGGEGAVIAKTLSRQSSGGPLNIR